MSRMIQTACRDRRLERHRTLLPDRHHLAIADLRLYQDARLAARLPAIVLVLMSCRMQNFV
jgi:hypothetical protein